MVPRRARRAVTPCFRRPPTCGAVAATGVPLSLLTSLSLSSATTHSLPSVSGLRRRGGQSGGPGSWNQADLGEPRTSDEWRPCSKGYRLAPFCGREIQVDIGAPDGFVLGGGMLTAECGRMVPVSVDPLGGGEHGRRRCPTRPRGHAGCRQYGSRRPLTALTPPAGRGYALALCARSHWPDAALSPPTPAPSSGSSRRWWFPASGHRRPEPS